jgi:hypothetical protein
MTAGSRQQDSNESRDALDCAIDDALKAALDAHPVDLRAQVLARLDEPVKSPPAWWQPLLGPAWLTAAAAVLLVIGVTVTWQHVDDTLARIGSRHPTARVALAKPHSAAAPTTKTDGTRSAGQRSNLASGTPAPSPAATVAVVRPFRLRPPGFGGQAPLPPSPSGLRQTGVPAAASDRVVAASVLEMDAMTAPASAAAVANSAKGDDAGPSLPGAPAGDLGDPIRPMPPLRPIVIQPLVSAPIVEAPPVSTLAQPFTTVPTVGTISRDPSDPGKPGGVRQ